MKITAKWLEETVYANGDKKYTAHCNILPPSPQPENIVRAAVPYAVTEKSDYNRTMVLFKHNDKKNWHHVFNTEGEAKEALDRAIHHYLGTIKTSEQKIELPL